MKVSLNWAQNLSNVDLKTKSNDELLKLATERLGGVEGVTELSKHYEGIVVAKVVSCEKHPNADKLSLCKIDDGGVVEDVVRDENGYVQVVCGAPNVREGLLVAWIPPASIVPSSYSEKELFVLEARDLRGEVSNGMLASPAELGLSDDHQGILEISEDVQTGAPFNNLFGLDDLIIDIENKMFTHRPDCFGQLGVARELAGIQGLKFTSPEWYTNKIENQGLKNEVSSVSDSQSPILSVSVESTDICPRYMAIAIDNVEIKPSPVWLQSYLKRVGIRPINNVVDITNYIMMLTAQPLHAFDFDKISQNGSAQIIVRKPKDGEKMTLLDGKTIQPHRDAALICNTEGPIALGGVMGGGNSEVDENTKRIVLECATFDMYNIRKTSMIHGIFTDAVTRFNKGQPAEQCAPGLFKAVQMFEELAGGKPIGQYVDSYPEKTQKAESKMQEVQVSARFINSRLGSSLSIEEITKILTNVEFTVEAFDTVIPDTDRESSKTMDPRIKSEDDNLLVKVPFWRTDIELPEDIVEEVGRLYGFNQLPLELPKRSIKPVQPDTRLELKKQIREILARAGSNEIITYSFVHGSLLERVGQKPENSYKLRNALSPELQYYRQTLTPSLLEKVHPNIKAGFDEFALFELNKTHNKVHGNDDEELPGELNMVALTYASNKNDSSSAYYSARRHLDYLASSLGFTLVYAPIEQPLDFPVTAPFDHTRSALVTIKEVDVFLGIVGEYRQEVVKNLKLPVKSAGFEIGLDHIIEALQKKTDTTYVKLSKYPSTQQDITLKVSQTVSNADLEDCLSTKLQKSDYKWKLELISVFQSTEKESLQKVDETTKRVPSVPTKNSTFRLTLSRYDRTLTTEEVNTLIEELTWHAHKALNAEQV